MKLTEGCYPGSPDLRQRGKKYLHPGARLHSITIRSFKNLMVLKTLSLSFYHLILCTGF